MAILIISISIFCLTLFVIAQILATRGRSSRRRRGLDGLMVLGQDNPDLSSQNETTHLPGHQPHTVADSTAHHSHHHHSPHHHHQPDMSPPPSAPPDMGSQHHSGGFDSGSHHSH